MHVRLIFRLYTWRFFKILFQIVAIFTLIIILVDFIDFTRRQGGSILLTLSITLLKLPTIIFDAIPFFILIAATTLLFFASRRHELVVLQASGLSNLRILYPLALAGFTVGLLTAFLLAPFAVSTQRRAQELARKVKPVSTSASPTDEFAWFWQKTEKGTLFIGGLQVGGNTIQLRQPVVIELGIDGRLNSRLDAMQGTLRGGQWMFSNVVRVLAIGVVEDWDLYFIESNLSRELIRWQFERPGNITLAQMPEALAAFRDMGLSTSRLEVRLYSLLAMPFTLIAMVLIAGTIGFKFSREGISFHMLGWIIGAGFTTYVLIVLCQALGNNNALPPPFAAALPALATAAGAAFLLRQLSATSSTPSVAKSDKS